MSVDFKAALRMQIAETSDCPGIEPYTTTAHACMLIYSKNRLTQIADTLKVALSDDTDKEYGICGTVQAYGLIPWLAASFPEADRPGYAQSYPIGRHVSDRPWSPLRKRLAAHCLGMIETFLAETAPSKAYKPTHGGYPCAS